MTKPYQHNWSVNYWNQYQYQYEYQQSAQYTQYPAYLPTGYGQYNQQYTQCIQHYNQQYNKQQVAEYGALTNNNVHCHYQYNDINYPFYQQQSFDDQQFEEIKANKIISTTNNNNNINNTASCFPKTDNNIVLDPSPNLEISLISKKYTLIKQIADGTFGDVWQIQNNSNKKQYALKLIRKKVLGKDVDIIKRRRYEKVFVDEANKLQYLNDLKTNELGKEFIIKCYGLCRSPSIGTALILELGKESLYEYITFHKINKLQIPLYTIRLIAVQLLSALSFIHGTACMVHCDLKPKNILINRENNRIKIIDFGNSLPYNIEIKSFEIQTLWYRAPELLFGQKYMISSSIDLWSTGCILFQLYFVDKPPLFSSYIHYNKENVIYKIWKHYSPFPRYLYNHYQSYHFKHIYKDKWKKDPFYHKDNDSYITLKDNRKNNLINIMKPTVGNNNNDEFVDFVDLICCLLDLNPMTRYNSEDGIRHKFIIQKIFNPSEMKQNRKVKYSTDTQRQSRIDNQINKFKSNNHQNTATKAIMKQCSY